MHPCETVHKLSPLLVGRYENTEKRKAQVGEKGILYMGMGVSGGEEGARNGMPGLKCNGSLPCSLQFLSE